VVNVTLKEDTELLDEVVVVGYGTQRKERYLGFCGIGWTAKP